ncbi:unnamed protein product [Bursaphelenchus okinawaensis]|uniref:Uncharacterized protein n=1 Tax=Bursaphelenchus okinawaensis TaxID=465554 RepID=A0A811LQ44_9BILA|nr:unnamed protein product [Bursaphelenchus okinawaensis]CAG9126206.1 unnamed protein product [Bursaphelenchus okinawaensis]
MDNNDAVTIVPFTEQEWNFVKNNLMTLNLNILKQVVEVLHMWEFRSEPHTPVVIRLTRLVISGILFDIENSVPNHLVCYNKQLVHSTVMIRFVSYLNEMCQSEDGPLRSVVDATSKIGIPPWIVQMRHSVAHADLPNLKELQNGVRFCRNWLWDIHWSQPVEIAMTIPGADFTQQKQQTNPDFEHLKKLVLEYCNVMTSKSRDATEKAANKRKIQNSLDGFRKIIREEPHSFVSALTKRLLVTRESMTKSKFTYDCSKTGNRVWTIPQSLATFWHHLIVVLEDCNCYGMFLNKVTQLCSDETLDFFEKSQYAGWSALLLNRVFITEISLSDYDLKSLIVNILDGFYFFSKNVFLKLLSLGDRISDEKKKEYISLWDIKADPMEVDGSPSQDDVLSLDSLVRQKDKPPVRQVYQEWDLTDVKASLGLTEQQSSETLNLRIPFA